MVKFTIGGLTDKSEQDLRQRISREFGYALPKKNKKRFFYKSRNKDVFISPRNIYDYCTISFEGTKDNFDKFYKSLRGFQIPNVPNKKTKDFYLKSLELSIDIPVPDNTERTAIELIEFLSQHVRPKGFGYYILKHIGGKKKDLSNGEINGPLTYYWRYYIPKPQNNNTNPSKIRKHKINSKYKLYAKYYGGRWYLRFEITMMNNKLKSFINGFNRNKIPSLANLASQKKFCDFWEFFDIDYKLFCENLDRHNFYGHPKFMNLKDQFEEYHACNNDYAIRICAKEIGNKRLINTVSKYRRKISYEELKDMFYKMKSKKRKFGTTN